MVTVTKMDGSKVNLGGSRLKSSSSSSNKKHTIIVGVKKGKNGKVTVKNVGKNMSSSQRHSVSRATQTKGSRLTTKEAMQVSQGASIKDIQAQEQIRQANLQAKQQFIEQTKGMTAKEFYQNYDVNIKSDGSYSLSPKPQVQQTQSTQQNTNSQAQETIKQSMNKRAPIDETTSSNNILNMTQYMKDNTPKLKGNDEDYLPKGLIKTIDLSIKNEKEVGLIADYGVNVNTVDWAKKTISKSNYDVQKSLQRDTTTELFINSPEANLQAYNTEKKFLQAQGKMQDFTDVQNLKTAGIFAGAVTVTALTGGVATSILGGGALTSQGLSVAKAGAFVLQVGYGSGVVSRGSRIVKNYDSSNPSKTYYAGRNLLAELGGVSVGSAIVKAGVINPESYKVSYRDTKINQNTNTQHISETGTIKTRGGKIRNVEVGVTKTNTEALIGSQGEGTYNMRVVSPKGKVKYSDVGNIEESVFSTTNKRGVTEFDIKTTLKSATGKIQNFFTKGSSQVVKGETGSTRINTYSTTGGKKDFNVVESNKILINNEPSVVKGSNGRYDFKTVVHNLEKGEFSSIKSSKPKRISALSVGAYMKTTTEMPFVSTGSMEAPGFSSGSSEVVVFNPGEATSNIPLTKGFTIVNSLPSTALVTPIAIYNPSTKRVSSSNPLTHSSIKSLPSLNVQNVKPLSLTDVDSENLVKTDNSVISKVDTDSHSRTGTKTSYLSETNTDSNTTTEPATESITQTESLIDTTEQNIRLGGFIPAMIEQPIIPIPPVFAKRKDNTLRDEYFDVEVRRQGRFVKANKIKLTRSQALDFGSAIVSRTSTASFKVTRSSHLKRSKEFENFNVENTKGSFKKKKNTFKKKKNIFIEEERFRINTPGELGEITYKGIKSKGFKL